MWAFQPIPLASSPTAAPASNVSALVAFVMALNEGRFPWWPW